jgi:hypothetical protein
MYRGFDPSVGSGLAALPVRDRAGLSRHHFSAGFLVYDELAQVQTAVALVNMPFEIKVVSQWTRLDFREPHPGVAVGATRMIETSVHVASSFS